MRYYQHLKHSVLKLNMQLILREYVMILIENRNILREKNRELANRIVMLENGNISQNVIVEPSKKGGLTLKIAVKDKMQYIHSKYDPEKDAERFINRIEVNPEQHILFVGTGLGYHIQQFVKKYPNTKFSIYEPIEEVLYTYVSHAQLPKRQLGYVFMGTETNQLSKDIEKLLRVSKGNLH